MKSLLEIIKDTESRRAAVPHFNFATLEQFNAIAAAAVKLNVPVIFGLSEGERDFVGIGEAVELVRYFREKKKPPFFLNADHTYSVERVREAAEAGFDSVIFDGAKLPLEENILKTREAVKVAKRANRKIFVEGELGYIGQSSQVLREVPAGAAISLEQLPAASQCEEFVRETKVDLFAPAVGNVHGIVVAEGYEERLFIERIREIKKLVKAPLVLHGGSGLPDGDFRDGIAAGIASVHISTELRVAWREGLEKSLREMPDEFAPYKILGKSFLQVKKVAENKLKLFGW